MPDQVIAAPDAGAEAKVTTPVAPTDAAPRVICKSLMPAPPVHAAPAGTWPPTSIQTVPAGAVTSAVLVMTAVPGAQVKTLFVRKVFAASKNETNASIVREP